MMRSIQQSADSYGFHLIYYDPNDLLERRLSDGGIYYSYFDVVFLKGE